MSGAGNGDGESRAHVRMRGREVPDPQRERVSDGIIADRESKALNQVEGACFTLQYRFY